MTRGVSPQPQPPSFSSYISVACSSSREILLPSLRGMQGPCSGSIRVAQTGSGHDLANRPLDFPHEGFLRPCQSALGHGYKR